MRLSYKYRVYPSNVQRQKLERSLDLLRDFYNAALQERRDAWTLNRIRINFTDQSSQVPEIRNTLNTDYQLVQARSIAQALRILDKAFTAFFRRVKSGQRPGYPRFKGKAFFNSIIYNGEGYRFRGGKLNVSLIGDLKIKLSRPFEGKIKEVVLKREGAKWFAILSCDDVPERPLTPTGQAIGIDVGIESFATLSDSTQIPNWRFYESMATKFRVAQRRVARRRKGSNRRRQAVAQLRTIHQRIFNQRADFQHKLSTDLVSRFDTIVVEHLNVAGLAKGRLAKHILDASWSSFIHKLTYKAEKAGRRLVRVDPKYTSQDCSSCGERIKKDLATRTHNCSCGLSLHRDHNAALNILSRGLRDQDLTYVVAQSVS